MNEQPPSDWRQLGIAASLGLILVVAMGIGGGGGWLLDHWLNTTPVFLVIGLLLGVAAGFYEIFRLVMRHFAD